jgi:hypothetical protein
MGRQTQWLYKKIDEDWIAESPMGKVKVKFVEKNKFGVLDHDVTLPSGVKVYNPMRVFPNNDGSELIFTGCTLDPGARGKLCCFHAAQCTSDCGCPCQGRRFGRFLTRRS